MNFQTVRLTMKKVYILNALTVLILSFSQVGFSSEAEQVERTIPRQVLNSIQNHLIENSWPSCYYDVVPKVINLHKYKKFVEVGVGLGGHAETILLNTALESYYGIDPYLFATNPNDQFNIDVGSYSKLPSQMNFDYLYQWVSGVRLAPFAARSTVIRERSVDAALLFENDSIDCIFVDADPRYECVLEDLQAWYPKLRKGGMILGDDYWMQSVSSAVNEYFKSQGKHLFFINSATDYKIWAVYK
jgi:hypothetical protein